MLEGSTQCKLDGYGFHIFDGPVWLKVETGPAQIDEIFGTC